MARRNPDEADTRITAKSGKEGIRPGVTYRLVDGRMICVPEGKTSETVSK